MLDLFRNTLSAWQWALLALVPPAIVALYFLKLKRQPLEVPSTYLWKRSIEDLHVNSLWQRLRQNLLLLLQLLLVALAMLALLRPGWEGTRLDGQRFILLVDNSASMLANDVEGAANRLAEAKRAAAGLINQMDSGMTAMIISFADTPQVVQEMTDNRRLLLERLNTIQPTAGGTDLRGALELAGGLANPGGTSAAEGDVKADVAEPQAATLYIFSDGRFDDVKGFSLGNLQPVYVPIGSLDAENLAITTFTTRRSEARPEERQAFAQVANFTDQPQTVIVELELDGHFLDAKEVEVPAGETAGVVFPLADAPAGALTARLKYALGDGAQQDVLPLDDVAYAALNNAEPGRVLVVTPGDTALELALATKEAGELASVELAKPDVLTTDGYRRNAESGAYDLVVYDQCVPPAMPRANTLLIGRLPPGPAWRGQATETAGEPEAETSTGAPETDASDGEVAVLPQIIDWDRAHPLLAHVELGDVLVADSLVLEPPPGSSVLVDSTAGPIAAIAPRDSYEDVVLGFEIVGRDENGSRTANTNWPRRLSFPTFWLNALEYLAGGIEQPGMDQVHPGQPVELRPPGTPSELTVIGPDGSRTAVHRTDQDLFRFHETDTPGVYQVQWEDQVIERLAVNLSDRRESDVRVRSNQAPEATSVEAADIRIGHVDVAATAGQTPVRKEAWKTLLAAALFVLLVEWYIYNRRVYL